MENMITPAVIREIVVQLVGFVLFFWVLKVLAWKPLLKLIDDRRAKIEKDFSDIAFAKKEVEQLKVQYQQHLQKIEDETRVKIQEAVKEGRQAAHGIEQDAREEAKRILEKAQANIQLEVEKARIELRRQVADLAIKATEQILKEKIDETKHRKMMMDFIEQETIKR